MPLPVRPPKHRAKRLTAFQSTQRKLLELQQQLYALEEEREHLHHREELLWQSLDQQESIVYHLGVMLAEHMDSDSAQTVALSALLNDVRAHQLKHTVGSGPCSGSAIKQLYTSQMLRAAVTPEQIAAIKQADVHQDLVPKFRELTMRLALLLRTSNQSLLCDTLSEKVDEYSGMVQLLHTAADYKLLALGLLNFDTMEYAMPPEGHWEQVCDAAEVRPDQERTLATGFRWYAQRRSELISELEKCAQKLQELLTPLHSQAAHGTSVLGLANPLDMEAAEDLQRVLENLDRLNRAIREVDRYCVYLSINTMEKRQLAQIAVSSYPFLNQPPACCAVIAQRHEAKQKALQEQRAAAVSVKDKHSTAAATAASDGKANRTTLQNNIAFAPVAGNASGAGSNTSGSSPQQQSGSPSPEDNEQQQRGPAQRHGETSAPNGPLHNPVQQDSAAATTAAACTLQELGTNETNDGVLQGTDLTVDAMISANDRQAGTLQGAPLFDFARMF